MVTRSYKMKFPCIDCGEIIVALTPRMLRCKTCNRIEKNRLTELWRQKMEIKNAVHK